MVVSAAKMPPFTEKVGSESITQHTVPINAVPISAGYSHTVAIGKGGTVWAWGNNSSGQLGDGTTTGDKLTPVQIVSCPETQEPAASQETQVAQHQAISSIPLGETPSLTLQTISEAMRRTVFVDDPESCFISTGDTVYTPDGEGGWLAATVGAYAPKGLPSADGYGHLVFFFHNNEFIGWDSVYMSVCIKNVEAAGTDVFKVTYANYAPNDAMCCPSLPDKVVFYQWNSKAKKFDSSGLPPDVEHPN